MRNIKVLRVSERKNFSHVYDDAYTAVENGKRIFVWHKHRGGGMRKDIQKYLISKQASIQHEQRIFPLLYAPNNARAQEMVEKSKTWHVWSLWSEKKSLNFASKLIHY